MIGSQGREANHAGRQLEQVVELEARARKFHICEWANDQGNTDLVSPRRLIRHVPYISIYGHTARSEFVAVNEMTCRTVRIECRWQQESGSIDEKMPYLFQNAVAAMPEREIVFFLGGNGARKIAVEWLRKACQRHDGKIIRVLDHPEFRTWFRDFAHDIASAAA